MRVAAYVTDNNLIPSGQRDDCIALTYWVKLADMKDYLMQTEMLTDKLEKEIFKSGTIFVIGKKKYYE